MSWNRIAVVAAATLMIGAVAQYPYDTNASCVYPEVCREPSTKFRRVLPVKGRFQWDDSGGFCGSASIQTMALTQGAWLSQDNIRKANRGGLCFGHTDLGGGCEVGPENYGNTALHLKLKYDVWNFMQPIPQALKFKKWMKFHLANGHPVMWSPMLKNDKHSLYGRVGVPGNGHFDHHEPIIGIGSNHDLRDNEIYDDDWIVHYSNYDLQPAFRKFHTLEDDIALRGNCKNVWPKKAVMYPCFYKDVTYGLAVKGLNMFGFDSAPRIRLDVDSPWEPRVRYGEPQAKLKGSLTVEGLTPGRHYIVYRFNSTDALPDGVAIDLLDVAFEYRYGFKAQSTTLKFEDPHPIMSDSSTYYVATQASKLHEAAIDSLKDPTPRQFLKVAVAVGEGPSELKTISRPKDLDADMSKMPYFKSLAARTPMNPGFANISFSTLLALMTFAGVIGGRWIFLSAQRRIEVLPQPLLG